MGMVNFLLQNFKGNFSWLILTISYLGVALEDKILPTLNSFDKGVKPQKRGTREKGIKLFSLPALFLSIDEKRYKTFVAPSFLLLYQRFPYFRTF